MFNVSKTNSVNPKSVKPNVVSTIVVHVAQMETVPTTVCAALKMAVLNVSKTNTVERTSRIVSKKYALSVSPQLFELVPPKVSKSVQKVSKHAEQVVAGENVRNSSSAKMVNVAVKVSVIPLVPNLLPVKTVRKSV